MDSTVTPTHPYPIDPTTRYLVRALAVFAAAVLVLCAWGLWANQKDTTKLRQDCIVATGRYAAAGYPSTYTPAECR